MPKYVKKTYRKRTTRYYAKKKVTRSAARRPRSAAPRRGRRRLSSSGSSYAKRMQDNTFQYIKCKYTETVPIKVPIGVDATSTSISIMGGKNSSNPSASITIKDVDPDGMCTNDMKQHQHFKITGMSAKIFFPEGTDVGSTPLQWSMAYSGSQVINPNVGFGPIQALATYETSSCSASRPITRYFKPNAQLQRLGVDWCQTGEYAKFGDVPPTPRYGGQLPVNAGSSLWLKVTRSGAATAIAAAAEIGRLQVTYYITYRGVLGNSSIV